MIQEKWYFPWWQPNGIYWQSCIVRRRERYRDKNLHMCAPRRTNTQCKPTPASHSKSEHWKIRKKLTRKSAKYVSKKEPLNRTLFPNLNDRFALYILCIKVRYSKIYIIYYFILVYNLTKGYCAVTISKMSFFLNFYSSVYCM